MLRNKGFQMIVGAIVITGVIIAWLMLGGEAPSNNPVQKESSGANAKVRNSTLAREVDGKKVWEFTVEEVEQIKSSGEAVLKGVKGKIYREDGSVLEVVAGGGKVKNEAKDFELNDKVVAVLSSGMRKIREAAIIMNKLKMTIVMMIGIFFMVGMLGTACAQGSNFSVKADTIEYDMQSGDGMAKGNVVLKQDGGTATAANAEFNSKTKSGRLTGGVVADRDDSHVVCYTFVMHNEDYSSAIGDARLTKGDKTLASERVDYYKNREYAETVGSWARLSMADGSILDAVKITYDGKVGVANATGGVAISSPPRDLTASADTAVYETNNSGYIELIGNAKATQDGNTVEGNRLRLNNTSNKAEASGNVKIVYVPKPVEKKENVTADENAALQMAKAPVEVA